MNVQYLETSPKDAKEQRKNVIFASLRALREKNTYLIDNALVQKHIVDQSDLSYVSGDTHNRPPGLLNVFQ